MKTDRVLADVKVINQADIKLGQYKSGRYYVSYGNHLQIYTKLEDAIIEMNACIFHAISCNGEFEDEEEDRS